MTDDTTEVQVKPPYQPLPRMKRLAITFVLLFVIWAILAYVVPYFMGARTQPTTAPIVQKSTPLAPDVQSRIDSLEARIIALEEKPAALQAPVEAAPDPRVGELTEKLSTQQSEVADLKKSIDDGNRRLAALTLFGQMKAAAQNGDSYRNELREFTALMQGHEAFVPLLAKLSPSAESGLPTVATLQTDFAAAMERALAPHASKWSEKIHSLIRVRRVGETQKGGDDEAVIARAEAKLQQGNIAQVLKELDQLSPPAADAMMAWKKQAAGYLDAVAALDALQVALFKPAVTAP